MNRLSSVVSRNQARKLVLLPVELKNREFHAHVLLASHLVQRGYRVVIGSHAAVFSYIRAMNANTLGGVYLDKSTQIHEVSKFISAGNTVMLILDQELSPIQNGLGVYAKRNVVKERLYKNTEEFIDGFFTVGPQISSIAKKVLPAHKVIETGWPRFELLEHHAEAIYDSEIKGIQDKFGDFCLFVSSFSLLQSIDRCRTLEPIAKLGWITDTFDEKWWQNQWVQLEKFIDTLKEWRRLGFTQTIVIRPHLYEDLDSWKDLVKGISGVHVVKKGEINSWLFAASSVLHRGSTVSIQSALINKPTYSLPECTSDEYAMSLDFSEAVHLSSPPPLVPIENSQISKQSQKLKGLIKNLNSGSPCEDIAQFIETLDIPQTRRVHKRRIYLTYISNYKSIRRGLGLIKDEIRRVCKLDVGTTVTIAIPWGLRSTEARRVLRKINSQVSVDTRVNQIAINLIEFNPRTHFLKKEVL